MVENAVEGKKRFNAFPAQEELNMQKTQAELNLKLLKEGKVQAHHRPHRANKSRHGHI